MTDPKDREILGWLLNACSFNEICKDIQHFEKLDKERPITDNLFEIFSQFYDSKHSKSKDKQDRLKIEFTQEITKEMELLQEKIDENHKPIITKHNKTLEGLRKSGGSKRVVDLMKANIDKQLASN